MEHKILEILVRIAHLSAQFNRLSVELDKTYEALADPDLLKYVKGEHVDDE